MRRAGKDTASCLHPTNARPDLNHEETPREPEQSEVHLTTGPCSLGAYGRDREADADVTTEATPTLAQEKG